MLFNIFLRLLMQGPLAAFKLLRQGLPSHSIARIWCANMFNLRLQRVLRMGSLLSQNPGEAA